MCLIILISFLVFWAWAFLVVPPVLWVDMLRSLLALYVSGVSLVYDGISFVLRKEHELTWPQAFSVCLVSCALAWWLVRT